jgi:hypothetical protein
MAGDKKRTEGAQSHSDSAPEKKVPAESHALNPFAPEHRVNRQRVEIFVVGRKHLFVEILRSTHLGKQD